MRRIMVVTKESGKSNWKRQQGSLKFVVNFEFLEQM